MTRITDDELAGMMETAQWDPDGDKLESPDREILSQMFWHCHENKMDSVGYGVALLRLRAATDLTLAAFLARHGLL